MFNQKEIAKTYNQVLKLLQSKSEIYRSVYLLDNYNDYPKLFHVTCHPNLGDDNKQTIGNGLSWNKELAMIKAVMEATERYYWLSKPLSLKQTYTYENLTKQQKNLLDPESVWFFKERFPEQDINWQKQPLNWMETIELTQNKLIMTPSCLFLPGQKINGKRSNYSDSTGSAAHFNLSEAYYNAVMETLEREAFAVTYYHRISLPLIEYKSMKPESQALIEYLNQYGLEAKCYYYFGDMPIPIVFTVLIDTITKTPPFLSIGMKADLNVDRALFGSINESFQVMAVRELYEQGFANPVILTKQIMRAPHLKRLLHWDRRQKIEHLNYLLSSKNRVSLKSLKKQAFSTERKWPILLRILKKNNKKVYALPLYDETTIQPYFHAVKVFMPDIVNLSLDTDKFYFENPRLYDLGTYFGSQKAKGDLTKVPHPFI